MTTEQQIEIIDQQIRAAKIRFWNALIGLVLGLSGFALVASVNWRIALGMFFIVWSINIQKKDK